LEANLKKNVGKGKQVALIYLIRFAHLRRAELLDPRSHKSGEWALPGPLWLCLSCIGHLFPVKRPQGKDGVPASAPPRGAATRRALPPVWDAHVSLCTVARDGCLATWRHRRSLDGVSVCFPRRGVRNATAFARTPSFLKYRHYSLRTWTETAYFLANGSYGSPDSARAQSTTERATPI